MFSMLPFEGKGRHDPQAHTHTQTLTTCIFRNIWKYEICKKLVTEVESVESLGIRKRGEHAHKIYFLNGVL